MQNARTNRNRTARAPLPPLKPVCTCPGCGDRLAAQEHHMRAISRQCDELRRAGDRLATENAQLRREVEQLRRERARLERAA